VQWVEEGRVRVRPIDALSNAPTTPGRVRKGAQKHFLPAFEGDPRRLDHHSLGLLRTYLSTQYRLCCVPAALRRTEASWSFTSSGFMTTLLWPDAMSEPCFLSQRYSDAENVVYGYLGEDNGVTCLTLCSEASCMPGGVQTGARRTSYPSPAVPVRKGAAVLATPVIRA